MSGSAAELVIRAGRPADLDEVEAIERASFGDPWPRRALGRELLADAMRLPLVAVSGAGVIGYLMAWRQVDELHVLNLAVAPAGRRRGIASRLLAAAVADALARGMVAVTLEVRESNDGAREFYRRHGFADVGRRPRYYVDTGEDALIMTLRLPTGSQ